MTGLFFEWLVSLFSTSIPAIAISLAMPRIITHNIRYATQSPFKGELPWIGRRQHLVNELRFLARYPEDSFICLQEVLYPQLSDILLALNNGDKPLPPNSSFSSTALEECASATDEWAYIGVGREDGATVGEYSPILYRPAVFNLLSYHTLWLSETPDKPSKGWDSSSTRLVTIGLFQYRQGPSKDKHILVMNTHLDDQGAKARLEGAKLILNTMRQYSTGRADGTEEGLLNNNAHSPNELPIPNGVILTGDFNSQSDHEAYREITRAGSGLVDVAASDDKAKTGLELDRRLGLLSPSMRYGDELTYTSFGGESPPERIDFIFLGPVGDITEGDEAGAALSFPWRVRDYAVIPSKFDDGVYLSDHRAVVVDAELRS